MTVAQAAVAAVVVVKAQAAVAAVVVVKAQAGPVAVVVVKAQAGPVAVVVVKAQAGPVGGAEGCFVAGTLVHVEHQGLTPIEHVRAKDRILSFDVEAGSVVPRTVVKVFESDRDEIVVLRFEGEEIRCTPPHRFYAGRWLAAKDLVVGDSVLGNDGRRHVLKAFERERISQRVFNLAVSVTHTYLVGRAGLVVHNTKDTNTGDGTGAPLDGTTPPKK